MCMNAERLSLHQRCPIDGGTTPGATMDSEKKGEKQTNKKTEFWYRSIQSMAAQTLPGKPLLPEASKKKKKKRKRFSP